MLYSIAKLLDARLQEKKFPFRVVYGPETTESVSGARERVVIWLPPDEKKDSTVPPRSARFNPRMMMRTYQAARVRVFARGPMSGATRGDHEERAMKVVDAVKVGLYAIVIGGRNELKIDAGSFIKLEDQKGSPAWSGAVYEFDLTVDRAVNDVNWDGEGAEEKEIGVGSDKISIVNQAEVSGPNGVAEAAFPFGG